MSWWRRAWNWVKIPALVVATVVTGGVVFGGALLFAPVTLPIAAGFGGLSAIAVALGGTLGIREIDSRLSSRDREAEECQHQRRLAEERQRKDARINELEANVRRLEGELQRANVQGARIEQLQRELDEANVEIRRLGRQNAIARRRGDQAGGGIYNVDVGNHLDYYSCFYTVDIMTIILKDYLAKRGKQLIHSYIDISELSNASDSAYVLAPLLSSETALLAGYIEKAVSNLPTSDHLPVKLLIPYLDLEKNHWQTLEIQIKTSDCKNKINFYLHNPKGSGSISIETQKNLINQFNVSEINFQLNFPQSPYLTSRQSKVDKISCGPIVAHEILLRLDNKSLDRTIPYAYGASEMIKQQFESMSTRDTKVVRNRFIFLSSNVDKSLDLKKEQESDRSEAVILSP